MSLALRVATRHLIALRPPLPTMWWENRDGDKWVPGIGNKVDIDTWEDQPPEGFVYYNNLNPMTLVHEIMQQILQKDVDACLHPEEMVRPTDGWIDGVEGRKCHECGGSQVHDVGTPWPDKWDGSHLEPVMKGNSTFSPDFVLAMVRPTAEELQKAIERVGPPHLVDFSDAVLLAANTCERCMNTLAWRYGLDWGYAPHSKDWEDAGTSCEFCQTPEFWDWQLSKTKTARLTTREELEEIGRNADPKMLAEVRDRSKAMSDRILSGITAERIATQYLAKLSPHQKGWETRRERDEFTENNIPAEHLVAWRKLKHLFKGSPDQRAEQFMEYLEEHPEESNEWLQEHADKEVNKAIREWEKEQRERAKLEKDCDKKQDQYETAWYREQERATKEKRKLERLKQRADGVCEDFEDTYDRVPFSASLSEDMAERVAARYQNKKKVKTQDGDEMTVYEYSDRQVADRNRKKAERLAKLEKAIGKLRSKVNKDLSTSKAALIVGLIDETFERVGNPGSAKDGHFGVSEWQKKHVTFNGGKATVKYVGKSGVEQHKTVSDGKLVKALKAAYDAAEGDELFGDVAASDINAYLKEFSVTAKDLRGFHANREMRERLKANRKGTLPTDPKKRKKVLETEFKKALEETASAVGHEPSTLRSQYLVPGLEDDYLKDGEVK